MVDEARIEAIERRLARLERLLRVEEPAVFDRESPERWRIVSGWEHGEALRVEAERLVLAGYPVTREPRLLAQASESARADSDGREDP